jgi:hypothetical protein
MKKINHAKRSKILRVKIKKKSESRQKFSIEGLIELKKSFNKRKNKSKTLIEDGIEGQKNKTKELGKKIKKNKNKDQNKK